MHWPNTGKITHWLHPFFMQHWTSGGRADVPFTSTLKWQYHQKQLVFRNSTIKVSFLYWRCIQYNIVYYTTAIYSMPYNWRCFYVYMHICACVQLLIFIFIFCTASYCYVLQLEMHVHLIKFYLLLTYLHSESSFNDKSTTYLPNMQESQVQTPYQCHLQAAMTMTNKHHYVAISALQTMLQALNKCTYGTVIQQSGL